jgi:hypothetical protein
MDFKRPHGDITTVIDYAPRTKEDDIYFPIKSPITWFYRSPNRRTINSVPQLQTTEYRGPATFGQTIVFDLNSANCGDMLHAIGIQLDLESWIGPGRILDFLAGRIKWSDPSQEWTWINSIGSCIIESAEFQVDDVCIERIDSVFTDIFSRLFPDINTQLGVGSASLGTFSRKLLGAAAVTGYDSIAGTDANPFNPNNIFTVEDGKLICMLPFWFLRCRYKESFPLVSCRQQVRVAVKFRSYEELVRRCCGYRESCQQVPVGSSLAVSTAASSSDPIPIRYLNSSSISIKNISLISYSSLLDEPIREQFLKAPFTQLYRELNTFIFDQPLKYAVTKSNSSVDVTDIALPLELNGPVEELIWVVRRKAVRINNEWTNYGPVVEGQLTRLDGSIPSGVFEMPGLVEKASIQVNGQTVIEMEGDWFRRQIAERHRGGIITYNSYIYGYSFADTPGEYQPSGWANMSRAQNVTLRLSVRTPLDITANPDGFLGEDIGQTWEVFCYSIGMNWLNFKNGICGRLYSS